MVNSKKLIYLVAAARPNFMKIAPLFHELVEEPWAEPEIVHTGQHYDVNMSDLFFRDLKLPMPHMHLGVRSGTHAEQTGRCMMEFEKNILQHKPDLTIVVGDVNSTMACTIAAAKVGCKVAHLEAGLRSYDRTMPEEINRIVTDALADRLWTPSADADENLIREGVAPEKIRRVGNIMIDSLEMLREEIERQAAYKQFSLIPGEYGVVTLHRPSNVDDARKLEQVISILGDISKEIDVIFPVHPRTRKSLEQRKLLHGNPRLRILEPLSYIPFMSLVFHARFVLTDSGGIQEETTYLGIPCLTLRDNTERPITVTQGTNRLCNLGNVFSMAGDILRGKVRTGTVPDLWDGHTAGRVVADIKDMLDA